MRKIFLLAMMLTVPSFLKAAEVFQLTWPTQFASPPAKFEGPAGELLPAFRMATVTLPESSIMTLALSQPLVLGLADDQARLLRPLIEERYRLIAKSELFEKCPSALGYCYAAEKPSTGLTTVYVPDRAGATTPVIVFLHGYGGSFLWYLQLLAEWFPHHIIIAPAYGISAADVPPEYILEALKAVSDRLGFSLCKPSLVGLSAGGAGACGVYVKNPLDFSRLICVAAAPPYETLKKFSSEGVAHFVSGALEPFVTSGEIQAKLEIIRQKCPAELVLIPGGDHFSLLSHPAETKGHLERWILDSK